mgnify:FL=1
MTGTLIYLTSPFENKGRISFAAFFENDDDGSDDRSLFIKGRYILAIILNIISREPDKYGKRYNFSKLIDLVLKVLRVRNFTNLL